MLLGNKKTQENEQNWCLVLNPLPSQIDKRKVALKIAEVFTLSADEATDLVSNTPIILLDNLTRSLAVKVKDYFRSTGAEMFLTNDIFLKRKCYRTVWPEPPNLSLFLQELDNARGAAKNQRMLRPDEALHEVRSLSKSPSSEDGNALKPVIGSREQSRLQEELNRTKSESENWRKKFDDCSRELEKLQKQLSSREQQSASSSSLAQEREKEIQKQHALYLSSEEKYEGVKEEYKQARTLFEEKFSTASKEIQSLKKKAEEFSVEKSSLEKARKHLEQEMELRTQKFERVDKEFRELRGILDAKLNQATQEVDEWKAKADEMNKKIHGLDQEKVNLEQRVHEQSKDAETWCKKYQGIESQLQAYQQVQDKDKMQLAHEEERLRELQESKELLERTYQTEKIKSEEFQNELRGARNLFEEKLVSVSQEMLDWKMKADEMSAKIWNLEQTKQNLELEINEKTEEAANWFNRYEALGLRLNELETSSEEEKVLRTQAEARQKENEQLLSRKSEETAHWQNRYEELAKQLSEFKVTYEREKLLRLEKEKYQKELEQEKLVLDQAVNESRRKYNVLQEEYTKQQLLFESESSRLNQEVESWKTKLEEMSQKVHILGQEKAVLHGRLNEQANEVSLWCEKHRDLMEKFQNLQSMHDKEKMLRLSMEDERKGLLQLKESLEQALRAEQDKFFVLQKGAQEKEAAFEKKSFAANQEIESWRAKVEEVKERAQTFERGQVRLVQELEDKTRKLQQGELKAFELEKNLKELRQSHEGLEKMLQANLKHLEVQEKELEASRRQIRDLNAQLDQRDLIQKKNQLANQLVERESRLKSLVKDQEKIEIEIREREESLRKILTEQEAVEKDLIEGKQAQRHYLEQAKKEKEKNVRFKTNKSDDLVIPDLANQTSDSIKHD